MVVYSDYVVFTQNVSFNLPQLYKTDTYHNIHVVEGYR